MSIFLETIFFYCYCYFALERLKKKKHEALCYKVTCNFFRYFTITDFAYFFSFFSFLRFFSLIDVYKIIIKKIEQLKI